eukprot:g1427.t1
MDRPASEKNVVCHPARFMWVIFNYFNHVSLDMLEVHPQQSSFGERVPGMRCAGLARHVCSPFFFSELSDPAAGKIFVYYLKRLDLAMPALHVPQSS